MRRSCSAKTSSIFVVTAESVWLSTLEANSFSASDLEIYKVVSQAMRISVNDLVIARRWDEQPTYLLI